MNQENTKKLYEKYPLIFKQKDWSIQESCMPWGFECENGWYWLIDNLCEQLQFNIDHNKEPQIEATQVKEKYGTLRFYTNQVSDNQDGMISLAEYMSGSICEKCGTTAGVTQNEEGWISTLCDKCREIRK